jgi:hypothetical protein
VDDTVLEALAFVVGTLVGLQNYEQSVVPTVSLIPAISKEKLENHPMTLIRQSAPVHYST